MKVIVEAEPDDEIASLEEPCVFERVAVLAVVGRSLSPLGGYIPFSPAWCNAEDRWFLVGDLRGTADRIVHGR